jgi:tRNA dimethylallyltransferase
VATHHETHYPLVVIVGPTASGKTALAVTLAKKFGGEIICADSRTVYKGMDIGTAKPTLRERTEVPHWGIDLVEPGESFNAADFKGYATRKIEEIRGRGNIPFLVGGTGLYVDAVVFDYKFGSKADPARRLELEALSLGELQDYCRIRNIKLPENSENKRYVIRAIERQGQSASRKVEPISSSFIVGIATDKDVLLSQIRSRTEQIFANGVVEETDRLSRKYGWESEAMTANIYQVLRAHLEGKLSLEQAKEKFTTLDWQLAKRQLTWLRRNTYITWLPRSEVVTYIETLLAPE